jgi:16S rRNA processing protein RimM
MGRMSAPFGIKGWIKLQPFTAAPENLQAYSHWWIGGAEQWQEYRVEGMEVHSAAVVVKLAGCEDRDAAALFRGREVAVPRDALPETAANEYYWSDLVGLKVVNAENEDLGTVSEVFATGANDVLVVQGDRERLIPFTEEVVKRVELSGNVIRVDWDRDY